MADARRWWGLFSLIPAIAMFFLDQSVLPVALPTIQKEFGAGDIALQWTVNAYLLATTVLVLVGGKVGDRIGYKRAYMLGMAVFGAASLFCGSSPDVYSLIAARALQGAGVALVFPASSVLLMNLFPASERGKAMGINVSVGSLFLILGPLVGGYIAQEFSWRWIFWVNIPITLAGLFMTLRFVPRLPPGEGKIDLPGFCFFTAASAFLVVPIMQGREWGWSSPLTLGCFALAILFAASLVWREKKAAHPFLDLSLFRHPVYKAVNITVFCLQFIMMIFVFRAIFFQQFLGWTPLKTGFITFLSSVPVLFVSPLGGLLSDRFGPKLPISIGFLLTIASFIWVPVFVQSPLGVLFFGLLAINIGLPLVFTPSYASAMTSVPPKKAGVAFGTITCLRYLGGSVGVAAIGSCIENIEAFSFHRLAPDASFEAIVSGGPEALAAIPEAIRPEVSSALSQALLDGFFYTHLAIACLVLLIFSAVFVLYNRKSAHRLPDAPAEGWD